MNYTKVKLTKDNISNYKGISKAISHIRTSDNVENELYLDGDKFVAILSVDIDRKYILVIEVSENYRRKGIAKELLKTSVNEYGCDKLSVNKKNTNAISLYKSTGWKVDHEDAVMLYMSYGTKNITERFNIPEEHEEFLLEAFLDKIRRYYVIDKKQGLKAISKDKWFVYNDQKQAIEKHLKFELKVNTDKTPYLIGKKHENEFDKKLSLYTVEGRGIKLRTKWYTELKEDVKVVKEETFSLRELCDKYGVKYEVEDLAKDRKKKEDMYKKLTTVAKDYINKNHKDLLGKSLQIGYNKDYLEDFLEGDEHNVAIVFWDLWKYNSRARAQTDEDQKKNEEFYKILEDIQKELEKHVDGEEFSISENGDWDDGLIVLNFKK